MTSTGQPKWMLTWAKFTDPYSRPTYETFPELPDCVTIVRMLIGLVYGISLGYREVEGAIGLMLGLSSITFLPLLYVEQLLKAQVAEYPSSVTFQGVPNAMATLVLAWTLIYTMNHPDMEAAFAAGVKVAQTVVADTDTGGSDPTADDEF